MRSDIFPVTTHVLLVRLDTQYITLILLDKTMLYVISYNNQYNELVITISLYLANSCHTQPSEAQRPPSTLYHHYLPLPVRSSKETLSCFSFIGHCFQTWTINCPSNSLTRCFLSSY